MSKKYQHIILIILSLICVVGHFITPPNYPFIHNFLFKLTYVPIVFCSIWMGRWISIYLTTLFCLVYLFHIFCHLFHHEGHNFFSTFLDLGLYYIVAWFTGVFSDSQKEISKKLSDTYDELKEKTSVLLEFENNARETEQLKTMGKLAGMVAHEVRTPLSGIQGAVEIIVDENTDDESRKRFSKTVYTEVQRINKVVSDFLNLGNQSKSELKKLSLKNFIEDSITILQPLLKKNNINLTISIPDDTTINIEPDPFKQVILNLVINSIHAIESKEGEIKIETSYNNEKLNLTFTDNGKGIPVDIKEKLFGAFVTGRKDGNGLGLYLSKKIIQSFGGELELVHSDSNGTVFKLSI